MNVYLPRSLIAERDEIAPRSVMCGLGKSAAKAMRKFAYLLGLHVAQEILY